MALTAIVGLFLFVVIPSTPALRKRQEISMALGSAAAIRLEEFLPGYGEPDTILTAQALTAGEYHHVIDALPITFSLGIPGLFKPCYVPHHRIVMPASDHRETTLGVCFACNEISFPDAPTHQPIIRMPHAWSEPLRALLLRSGVPFRDHYAMHAEAQ